MGVFRQGRLKDARGRERRVPGGQEAREEDEGGRGAGLAEVVALIFFVSTGTKNKKTQGHFLPLLWKNKKIPSALQNKKQRAPQMTTLLDPLRDAEDAERVLRPKSDERKLKKKEKKKSRGDGDGEKMKKEKKKRKSFDADGGGGGGGDNAAPAASVDAAASSPSQPPKKKKKVRACTAREHEGLH